MKKKEMSREMRKSAVDQFINHLEFVGYEIEPTEGEDWIFAKHEAKGGLIIKEFPVGILIQAFFKTNNHAIKKRLEYLEILNQFNLGAFITTYSSTNDDKMLMTSFYTGKYDKKTFSNFLDAWNTDTNDRVYKNEEFKKFIL